MWPSIITSFSYPSTTSRLDNPSHSNLHNTTSSAVGQIQAFIGRLDGVNASALGTLVYDIRASASNGGGHVQTAVKGGTGQTTFTKGDLFVAINSSTISKLAVGLDGQQIVADSSVAAGVKWVAGVSNKIFTSVISSVIANNTVTESSIFSVSLPGSVLGTNNAVVAKVYGSMGWGAVSSVIVTATYGGGRVASVILKPNNTNAYRGYLEYRLLGNGAVSAQYGELFMDFNDIVQGSVAGTPRFDFGVASVASGGNQVLGMTVRYSGTDTGNAFRAGAITVEKIV